MTRCCKEARRIVDDRFCFKYYCKSHGMRTQHKRVPAGFEKYAKAYKTGGIVSLTKFIKESDGLSLKDAFKKAKSIARC